MLICTAGIILASRMHPQLALLLHRDYFHRLDASLSCSFAPQGLLCPSRMHLYLALLLHRDYFHRPNASLSSSFAPQGLFPPARFISISLFCSTGIISADRIHLYLALLLHRDYFHRPDSSLSCSFVTQGLFCPGRMHLYLAFLLHRDYFAPAGCISILLFCSTRIISIGQMHLYLALLLHRDYLRRSDSSPACSFAPQGLFPSAGCISIFLFCSTGIISTGQMHLYLALLLHRDYFAPVGCIPIFLFCSTGIISAGRMHLYLALLLHRDYFRRPDSSLSCSFVSQGLFPPAKCISILLFCFTEITSAGRMHL